MKRLQCENCGTPWDSTCKGGHKVCRVCGGRVIAMQQETEYQRRLRIEELIKDKQSPFIM